MCECGCGNLGKFFKLPAPKGWYMLHVYPGCSECDAPAGVTVVEAKTRSTQEDHNLESVDEPDWVKTYSWREFSVALIDPNRMVAALIEQLGETWPGDSGDPIKDWSSEIKAAVWECAEKTVFEQPPSAGGEERDDG